ncbi:MAG TPA: MFS transporter [Microlunatus sp.]
MRWNDVRPVVHNRALVLLVLGRSISWYGNALAPMAIVFAILDLGLPVGAVSIAVLARSVPQLLLVLIGGTLADRWRSRQLLVLGSAVAGASQATMAVLLISGHGGLLWVAGLSVINGVSAALAGPAAGALFRSLVAEPEWKAASILERTGQQLGLMLGLSTGGILIGWAGAGAAIAVDALTFAVATGCFLIMRTPQSSQQPPPRSMLSQLSEGFGYLRRRRWLIMINIQSLITAVAFAGGLQVLAAVVADASFGRAGLGLASGCQTGGAVLGLVIAGALPAASRLGRPLLLGAVVALPLITLAVGPWLLGNGPLVIVYVVAMLVTGAASGVAGIWKSVIVLGQVDQAMIGRVGSYGLLASIGGLPLGEALAAPLDASVGSTGGLLILAAIVVLVAIWAALSPAVRKLGYESSGS